jgi:polyisoprenoid-binding protein YceI
MILKKLNFTAIVILMMITALGSISCATATLKNLNVTTGKVDFLATGHPSALKIRGVGQGLEGSLILKSTNVTGDVTFALSSLDTGVELRNHHMKEKYLQVSQFPQAKLTLTKLTLSQSPLTAGFHELNVPFDGTLELHGVTKPVQGTAEIVNNNGEIACDAQFSVKISDFAVAVPKYLGITVADDVNVNTHLETQVAK